MPDHIIFSSGRDGYGDAVGHGEDTYHFTYNMDARYGVLVPSAAPVRVTKTQISGAAPILDAVEWEDANGVPIVLAVSGNGTSGSAGRLIEWKNGALSVSSVSGGAQFTGAALYRYDQDATADPDEEMLFMCTGSSGANLHRRKKDGTVDQGATSAHDVKADRLAVVGSRFWISQDYKVAQCTADADPGKDASYPTKIPVGRPSYPVNEMLDLGAGLAVIKGDGVFVYNEAKAEMVNILPFQNPHPDHGKRAKTDGRGRLYIPTADGDLIVMSFSSASLQRPGFTHVHRFSRDTPISRISAIAVDMETVYVTLEGGAVRTQAGLGLYAQTFEAPSTYTDATSALTDQSYATSTSLAYMSSTSDYLYIGANEKFHGVYFELLTARTATLLTGMTVEYSAGSGAWTAISEPLDGTMAFAQSGLLSLIDATASDLTDWETDTVNSVSRYWIRIGLGASDALTGAALIEVSLVPRRPPLDPDANTATGYALSGTTSKIIAGRWEGERLIWHDVWTLRDPRIETMVTTRVKHAGGTALRSLACFAFRGVTSVPIGVDGHPLRQPFPKLGDYGESGTAFDEHVTWYSGYDFASALGGTAEVEELVIEGEHMQSADTPRVYYWWDNAATYYKAEPAPAFPLVVRDLEGHGSVLYVAYSFTDAARSRAAPLASKVYVPEAAARRYEKRTSEAQDFQSPPVM